MNLQDRLRTLINQLSQGLYEKDDLLALGLLAAVSGESLFLLGPPGVAKSMVARRLRLAFRDDTRCFEYLLNRFSTPDELFGPVSISGLKEDHYERLIEGYLPDAHVVFLDEIWKASPSILNTLLTILNERILRNGRNTVHLPLRLLLAASNELPAEGEGLEALWDRFLLRRAVSGIQSLQQFDAMLLDTQSEQVPQVVPELQISPDELLRWQDAIRAVVLPQCMLLAIHAMRQLLERPDSLHASTTAGKPIDCIYVSDRRWRKAVHLLRACAFINNSNVIHLSDLAILTDVLWNETSQKADIERLLTQSLSQAIITDLGIELHQERLDAMRDQLKSVRHLGVSSDFGHEPLRDRSFYYQLQHPQTRPILMFISEYEELCRETDSIPFILQTDTKKLGAQVLKKYERSRHPGIFPKDILQVTHVPGGVKINGKIYPLVVQKSDAVQQALDYEYVIQNTEKISLELREALLRIQSQILEASSSFNSFRSEEEDYAAHHLILTSAQHILVRQALDSAQYAITRLSGDVAELCHTYHIQP